MSEREEPDGFASQSKIILEDWLHSDERGRLWIEKLLQGQNPVFFPKQPWQLNLTVWVTNNMQKICGNVLSRNAYLLIVFRT